MERRHIKTIAALALAGTALWLPGQSHAAESGAGFYLLGSKGPAAAIMPPPGVFFQNDFYIYSGELGGGTQLPTGGKIAVGVEGKAAIEIPTVIWVLPEEVMGGHLGLSASLPVGWKETSADVTLTRPLGGIISGSTTDPVLTVGDPLVSAFVGWEAGDFHYQVGTMVNIPIGDYQDGELSNIAFHHWGADVFAAATWLNPETGIDISGVLGMTFNAENPATDYRTGNELHFEWAVSKQVNEQFSAGIIGYYYNQVTGDSGDGAARPFKGEASAIGATIGWNFKFGEHPVAARIKYFHEFNVTNRAEGDAVYLSFSVPLSITKPTDVAAR